MKRLVRVLAQRLGVDVRRLPPSPATLERAWVRGGRRPWSRGYPQAKERFLQQVLADADLMRAFERGSPLPRGFGFGLDERCVEYPWALAKLNALAGRVLDAGSTLNDAFLLEHRALSNKQLHILTLAPEGNCLWHKSISYLYEDLRDLPTRDAFYEVIVCISTLEHVGWDNSAYTERDVYREQRPEDFIGAMQEFRRVLKPGGTLLLTVPYGAHRFFGTFQVFNEGLLTRAVEAFGPCHRVEIRYYRYTAEGWNLSNALDCAECEYVPWVMQPASLRPPEFPVEADAAAAARAVACVELVGSALAR